MSAAAPFGGTERMLAWRYLRAKRAEGGISIIAWFSFTGILLSVGTLIVVTAVMIGFRQEFVRRVVAVNPHVQTWQYGGIRDYERIAERLGRVEGVTLAAPSIIGEVMATEPQTGLNAGVIVRGMRLDDIARVPLLVEPEEAQGNLADLEKGRGLNVALGWELAESLGVRIGDRVTLISAKGRSTVGGTVPKTVGLEVVYIFRIGIDEYDKRLAYMPLRISQIYFDRRELASTIDIFVEDPDGVVTVIGDLRAAAGPNWQFQTWQQVNSGFIAALNTQRVLLFVILSLLVLIAVLNIITGLVMLVKNKRRDIAILRTMGLTRRGVMRVFLMCGAAIGVFGTIFGVIAGVLFALNIQPILGLVEAVVGQQLWDSQVYQLSTLPAELRAEDIGAVVILSLGMSFLATLIPSWRAARLDPVEALRNE